MGQGTRSTSSGKGGAMLSTPEAALQARMLSKCGADASDGCQRSAESARAK
jgi:hypothetical protein